LATFDYINTFNEALVLAKSNRMNG